MMPTSKLPARCASDSDSGDPCIVQILDRISCIAPSYAAFRKLGYFVVAIPPHGGGMGMSELAGDGDLNR
jgi:hypothetical protein